MIKKILPLVLSAVCLGMVNSVCAELEARSLLIRLTPDAAAHNVLPSTLQQQQAIIAAAPKAVFPFSDKQSSDSRLNDAAPEADRLRRWRVVELQADADIELLLRSLSADPAVEVAAENGRTSLPPMYKSAAVEMESDSEDAGDNWALLQCGFPKAWETATGKGVRIAIVDTGIDFYHPDLIDNININESEDVNGNGRFEPWPVDEMDDEGQTGDLDGIDNDGNGYTDDVIGYDVVDQAIRNFGDDRNRDGVPFDENGHGTAVAGVLAAVRGNDEGVIGAAYDAKIISVRAFDVSGNADDDDMAAGLVYAALSGADVINLSFGDVYHSPILRDAARFAAALNCLLVASAGNDGSSLSHYPSDHDEVMSIGATTPEDNLAIFSVRGATVDMVAPGVAIPTTAVGGTYREVGGTSFAAPYVAAAAALVMERAPEMEAAAVGGVLMATAADLGETGWDDLFSNGRLDARRALERVGGTQAAILAPDVDSEYSLNEGQFVEVEIDAATPLFAWYDLAIGTGRRPQEWRPLTDSIFSEVRRSAAARTVVDGLTEGTHTLRLRVGQTNGEIIEQFRRIDVVSAELEANATLTWAWRGFERVLVVEGLSSRRTRMALSYAERGADPEFGARKLDDLAHLTRGHHIVLDDFDRAGSGEYDMTVVFAAPNGDSVAHTFEFSLDGKEAPERGFRQVDWEAPDSYLLDAVAPLGGPGTQFIAVNDISSGDFGAIKTYRWSNGMLALADSLDERWIPRGFGDSDGDGLLEVFAQSGGESVLFEAETAGGNPFARQIFSERTSGQFWASAMYDFDGDGREELLVRSDSEYQLYDFADGGYRLAASAPNSSAGSAGGPNLFGPPLAAIGNFDLDPQTEICFGDLDADFLVYEYKDGAFRLEHLIENEGSGGSQFVAAVDVDGDGNDELLTGFHTAVEPNFRREYDTPMWTYLLLDLDGGTPDTIWSDHFYGLRVSTGFRNGVAAGQLDDLPGEEFAIAGFPNLFIFGRDADGAIAPRWHYPSALTNAALIHDFDGNGRNEIGFNTNGGLRFFEAEDQVPRPATPQGVRAWALSGTTARVEWHPVDDAREYVVVKLSLVDGETRIDELPPTQDTYLEVDGLENETRYFFGVVSINDEEFQDNPASIGSRLVEVFIHPMIEPVAVRLTSPQILSIEFSGPLSAEVFAPDDFRWWNVESPDEQQVPASVIPGTETSISLFLSLPPGRGDHVVSVPSLPDRYNSPTTAREMAFAIGEPEAEELYLSRLEVVNRGELLLTYSKAVEGISAGNALNYDLKPQGSVLAVEPVAGESAAVRIRLDPATVLGALGRFYTVQVTNVLASDGAEMTRGAGNTLGFTFTEPNLDEVFAYPNPVRYGEDEEVVFAGLTEQAEVTVLSMEGRVLARLTEVDGNGGVSWNLRDLDGNLLESGVYLYSVSGTSSAGSGSESGLKKFVVLRGE